MPKFKSGDFANAVGQDGEVLIKVVSEERNGSYHVQVIDEYGMTTGRPEALKANKVLPLRSPNFAIRGQVLTTSPTHSGEVGEIIGTGLSKSLKSFFKVLFSDGKTEWFSEDQVFIDDEVQREYEERKKKADFIGQSR